MQNPFGLIATPPGPALCMHRERSNLIIFAFLAAVLAALSIFHARFQLEDSALEAGVLRTFPSVAVGEIGQGDRRAVLRPASNDPRIRALTEYLSKRYLVSAPAMENLILAAHDAGKSMGLDPLLIIAVMAVESRFNPLAESVAGAKGLMQVIPKYHWDKFPVAEDYAVLEPRNNIVAGAKVIREYLHRTGNLTAALQMYVGAPADPDNGYAGKVLAEQQRLQQVVRQVRI